MLVCLSPRADAGIQESTPSLTSYESHGYEREKWGVKREEKNIRLFLHGDLDSVLKSRDITQSTKVHVVKAMVFPVVTHGWEKAECQRIDAFEWWCWRRLMQFPWAAKRSNQSILREIDSEYSLERLTLKLKFLYFDHLMWTADLVEKSLMLGKTEGRRRRGRQRRRWLDSITDAMNMNLGKLGTWWGTGRPGMLQSTGSWSQTWLGDWTTKITTQDVWKTQGSELRDCLRPSLQQIF